MNTPVDLKEQFEKNRQAKRGQKASFSSSAPKAARPPAPKAEPDVLDEMYQEKAGGNIKAIDRPAKADESRGKWGATVVYQLIIAVLLAVLAYQFFGDVQTETEIKPDFASGWYKVSLQNGDYFYGFIDEVSDPLIVTSVYYDYDQKSGQESPDKNIRLIKAQEDLSGTDGSVIVPFAGAKYEPLSAESKVLQAILEYEK